jgi:F-type H+-transporting ATPase subunit delta
MRLTIDQYAKLIHEADKTTDEKDKKTLIKGIAGIIKKNRDFKKFDKIEARYKTLKKKESGLLEGVVYTKIKLEKDQLAEIKKAVAKEKDISENSIKLENRVDLSLKGGFVVKLENEIFDGSLDGKIRRIKEALIK